MLPAMSGDVPLGKPHVDSKCHVDPYFAELEVRMDCTLTQGFKRDEEGKIERDADGNRIRKPVGTIHLGDNQRDPVMVVNVGLRGPLLHHLCGWLCVRVHMECVGTGPEKDYFSDPRKQKIEGEDGKKCCQVFEPDDWCYYTFEVTIPRDDFKGFPEEEECGEFCCFATTVTSYDRCDNPGHIGCWCNGPCVMIHQAPAA